MLPPQLRGDWLGRLRTQGGRARGGCPVVTRLVCGRESLQELSQVCPGRGLWADSVWLLLNPKACPPAPSRTTGQGPSGEAGLTALGGCSVCTDAGRAPDLPTTVRKAPKLGFAPGFTPRREGASVRMWHVRGRDLFPGGLVRTLKCAHRGKKSLTRL